MKAKLMGLIVFLAAMSAHAEFGIYCSDRLKTVEVRITDVVANQSFELRVNSHEHGIFTVDPYSQFKHERFALMEVGGQNFIERYSTDLVDIKGERSTASLQLSRNGKGSQLTFRDNVQVAVNCVRGL